MNLFIQIYGCSLVKEMYTIGSYVETLDSSRKSLKDTIHNACVVSYIAGAAACMPILSFCTVILTDCLYGLVRHTCCKSYTIITSKEEQ